MCVYVCVRERERERSGFVRESVCLRENISPMFELCVLCVCVFMFLRENLFECV